MVARLRWAGAHKEVRWQNTSLSNTTFNIKFISYNTIPYSSPLYNAINMRMKKKGAPLSMSFKYRPPGHQMQVEYQKIVIVDQYFALSWKQYKIGT